METRDDYDEGLSNEMKTIQMKNQQNLAAAASGSPARSCRNAAYLVSDDQVGDHGRVPAPRIKKGFDNSSSSTGR